MKAARHGARPRAPLPVWIGQWTRWIFSPSIWRIGSRMNLVGSDVLQMYS